MWKKLVVIALSLWAAAAFAAADANKATAAELDAIKGIGPAISAKIVDERKSGAFKDWNDLITRVKGIGETNAAKLSSGGLTVNGASFSGATPAATKKADDATPAKSSKAEAKQAETKADAGSGKDTAKSATKLTKEEKKAEKAKAKASAAEAKASEAKPAKK